MGAFSFFKAAINVHIPVNEHPSPAISKIQGNLNELARASISMPAPMRMLIILSATPPHYDTAIQLVLGQNKIKSLTMAMAQEALVASWEQSKNKGQSLAQKISAIKQKGNQSFSQQQQHR